MSDRDESKTPLEVALDYLVYAPLGFTLEARTLMPRFVNRGRSQIVLAKVIGKYAVRKGEAAAGAILQNAPGPAVGVLRLVGLAPEPNGSPGSGARLAVAPDPGAPGGDQPVPATRREAPFDADTLAIPDYDSLSASQVVPRLEGLSADELELVRVYEQATRGRKTILSKITQLQAA